MIIIRDMEEKDYKQKSYIHYQSWIETYTGLMDPEFLSRQTLEYCEKITVKYPENTIVAEYEGNVVGFAAYCESRDELDDTGEVMAIYVLKAYQKRGIGKALMDECVKRLDQYQQIIVWVLTSNIASIMWYENYGFKKDGHTKNVHKKHHYELHETRLTLKKTCLKSLN